MVEGDIAIFFVKDLGLALAPKMCPNQSQTFKRSNIDRHLTAVGRKKMSHFFFLTSRFQVLQGMFVESFAQKIEELTA